MKMRIVILASGGGGNLKFLHNAIKVGLLEQFEIAKIIAPRTCGATDYGNQNFILSEIVDFKNPTVLSASIQEANPDLVISNVNLYIHETVYEDASFDFVNLHYSLLPAFKGFIGINSLKQALDYGATIAGASVHKISAELDGGKPLSQVAFVLNRELSEVQLMNSMFKAGAISLFAYLCNLSNEHATENIDYLELGGTKYLIGPPAPIPVFTFQEQSLL